MSKLHRRSFIASTALASLWPSLSARAASRRRAGNGGPVVISSGNGIPAVTRAMEGLRNGEAPAEAVVAGVTLVEDDPNDMSVGLGGLPNEDGVVQLDASVMDGPSHKAGAVGALENVRNAAQVALEVLRRTDHVMLVGAGALEFALAMGFEEQDLLTPKAREAWLRWKRNLNPNDDWLNDDQLVPETQAAGPAPWTHGTIHCAALDASGDLGACTTTSGLSWKLPGRVGDSPIIGAGMFVDNEVGAAGATGRGESVILSCGSFQTVQHMARGAHPTEACLETLRWIARHTKRRMLLNDRGEPNFGATLYAVRKDGAYGSATMRGRAQFAVNDGAGRAGRIVRRCFRREGGGLAARVGAGRAAGPRPAAALDGDGRSLLDRPQPAGRALQRGLPGEPRSRDGGDPGPHGAWTAAPAPRSWRP